ncbi:restriction endonuclease subunit S [Providencia stuartii]|uniref:restriction endonuclease subunit S n=1 Tax=Gammaproteobacteria TaxID=1236 RepID=UPI00064C904B|nr:MULTISPECIES: restriction endonuclease subunit S [Vibrio]ELC9522894.1 restriction endonuclease subunit S [Vibrio alginolyticus]HBC3574754.1 restriction endonuclease subunit S [Vibrio parahaemolyticus]HBC5064738.1 restriction endonuclease subunit S [Proteus mirabilis]HEM6913018.1 restriction endonuclease subunit S [Providencia stuartii]EKF9113736.1 restriction endonuclease subunit S [Vibrio cholerae]
MSKSEVKVLVPKLRFPEFRNAQNWNPLTLGEVSDRITEKVGERQLTTVSITAGKGFVSQAEKFSRDISGKQYKNYIALKKGEFSYNKGNSKTFPQGAIYKLHEFDEVAAPNAFISFRFKDEYVADFYKGYFENNFHGRQLLRYITSGARSDGLLNINPNDFFKIILPTPVDKIEQQKIADCLSSIDELIEAEGEKLDELKAHKKGLVQQLFPSNGKTVPQLRFPEFQNDKGWMREELFNILDKIIDYRGKAPPKAEIGVPLITAKNVRSGWLDMSCDEYIAADKYESWMSKGMPKAGDILFTTEAPLGHVAFFPSDGKFALGQRILTLRTKPEKCIPEFLFQSLLGPQMQNEINFNSTGSTAKGIKSSVFSRIGFCYPEIPEQRKIASFLSSIDKLILSEAKKVEKLKEYKKGLMQQLFPSIEGVDL